MGAQNYGVHAALAKTKNKFSYPFCETIECDPGKLQTGGELLSITPSMLEF